MRLEGWCEPTDIALCVVREHVVEQIAAAFAKTLDTASPDNEVMVFGRELMLGRHRRNMAEATA